MRLLIADKGTGVERVVEVLDELDDPPLLALEVELLELVDESAEPGVLDASALLVELVELEELIVEVLLATDVELPAVELDSADVMVVEDRPEVEDGVIVATVPLDDAEVRPEVPCAAEPPLDVP